jgi:hypothetical protein
MSFSANFLAPLALLLPSAGAADAGEAIALTAEAEAEAPIPAPQHVAARSGTIPAETPGKTWHDMVMRGFSGEAANQVRIEQRMTIRINPRPAPVTPDMFAGIPTRSIGPRFTERKMGKCLRVSRIAGVQTSGRQRLILFMRDQRIVSAELERACSARDFYSGFYLSRSDDGKMCVDRDTLLSRSGANCKITRLRQLIETRD